MALNSILYLQVLDQLSSIIASYVIVPNPPEDLQVVPDVPLEEEKQVKSPTAVQSSTEVDRKPFLTIPESNGERTPNATVSFLFHSCYILEWI